MIGLLVFWGWVAFSVVGLAAAIVYAVRVSRRLGREAWLSVEVRR